MKNISELREALASKDTNLIKQKLDVLQKTMQEIGTAAYQNVGQQQSAAPGSGEASSGPPPAGGDQKEAVDVDYKVVDDKK